MPQTIFKGDESGKVDYYRELTLQNGQTCILKTASADDAADVLRNLRLTSQETDNMLRCADEITLTEEQERVYLAGVERSSDAILICAVVDGVLAGAAGFNPVGTAERCRHRAEFGISVQRKFWGMGIGTAALAAVVDAARQAGYEQLELDVVVSNRRAIALYQKFGFIKYGLHPGGFRYRDGHYEDLFLMLLPL